MVQLSAEAKEGIVQQALNRGSNTIESIARSNNVGLSTLQKWLRRYREGQPLAREDRVTNQPKGLSRAEQFEHILSTHNLDEVSLGEYCRKHGLYSHQLTAWREELMSTNQTKTHTKHLSELKQLKDENKRLQRELNRKDKALAEASALLILKKKADLIWGVDEDA